VGTVKKKICTRVCALPALLSGFLYLNSELVAEVLFNNIKRIKLSIMWKEFIGFGYTSKYYDLSLKVWTIL
jgi:hypothetical protein